MLKVNDLACIRNQQLLFHQLQFQVQPGEALHIQGDNGSGKSSLLLMLLGLLTPQQGTIHWQNKPIRSQGNDYYQHLIYIGHKIGIKNHLTIRENLHELMSPSVSNAHVAMTEVLQLLGLTAHSQRLCAELSAGQRQRVALARLFLLNKPLWILDEPLTAVDQATTCLIEQRLVTHVSTGGMVVFTHHRPLALAKVTVKQLQLGL